MSKEDAIRFSVRMMSAGIVLAAVLSVQEAICKTLELIPIPQNNIWWNWLIAVVRVIIAFSFVIIFAKLKWVDIDDFT
jgi:hypothetical protein